MKDNHENVTESATDKTIESLGGADPSQLQSRTVKSRDVCD